jgi:2-polyprenyl-3-methyl-5-hydroxy-6-metoxy-1,4-benzoquinol methylase
MTDFDKKKHWENIYDTKNLDEVSWYEPTPQNSIDLITQDKPSKNSKIIDIGGGDSFLVDHLLDLGFTNVTVLDISEKAIDRAKSRLGIRASQVKWIVFDITKFVAPEKYDIWHDRAAFHFLTNANEVISYVDTAKKSLNNNANLIIGTFSDDGPLKCSGIEITKYSETTLKKCFQDDFTLDKCINYNHSTPFNTMQNFVFCSFKRI